MILGNYLENYDLKFRYALILAVFVHITAVFIIFFNKENSIKEIPFRTISLKIGMPEHASSTKIYSANSKLENHAGVSQQAEKKINSSKAIAEDPKKVNPLEIKKINEKTDRIGKDESTAKVKGKIAKTIGSDQQNESKQSSAVKGSQYGNRVNSNQETISSYNQLISLWIEKHKIYPPTARKYKIEGTANVKIKVRRDGRIMDYNFTKKTGHYLLDDAVSIIVESSNPAPPIPDDYPGGEVVELIIPIRFTIDSD